MTDIQAAAQRAKEVFDDKTILTGDDNELVNTMDHYARFRQHQEDCELLAREHIAYYDDTVIDREWAKAHGMEWTDDCYHDGSGEWEASINLGSSEVVRFRKSETMLDLGVTYWCNVQHCTTRGQVLRLLKILRAGDDSDA